MWLIGSPPCTAFCQWKVAVHFPKSKDRETVKKAIGEGRRHLTSMVSIYRKQLAAGRHFLHEHPATAVSWKEQGIICLARNPLIHCVVAHQCAHGLTTPDQDGNPAPAMKPTRFMTSSTQIAAQLSRRCSNTHTHQQLVRGKCAACVVLSIGTCACNSSWHEERNNGRTTLYGQTQ